MKNNAMAAHPRDVPPAMDQLFKPRWDESHGFLPDTFFRHARQLRDDVG
jgi:hypothetical protein